MNAAAIARALDGKPLASGGFMCRCVCHDDHNPSLKIDDGDNGRILVHCFRGCDWRDVKAALRDQGLLPEWEGEASHTPVDPAILAKRTAEREADDRRRIEYAQQIWREAKDPAGTAVEVYLRSRAITLDIPQTIRFANLTHRPTGLLLPAMVCAIQGPGGEVVGCHRTFLRADGKVKAPVTGNKMMIGKCRGGAVRLGKAGEKLGISEGIENGLSVAQSVPDLPVWAGLSTGGMKTLILPDIVKTVTILADADEAGEQAAQEAGDRFLREDRDVRIARPIREDFNTDLMMVNNVVPFRRENSNVG